MNECGLRMEYRKYSEGRKDHWFVSESNGLSYASEFLVPHPSWGLFLGYTSERLASYL